jgi:hypothetical protein
LLIEPRSERQSFPAREDPTAIMTETGRFRHAVASFLLWGVFLCLYATGAGILLLGTIFTGKAWWIAIHQHAALSSLFVKTGEILLLGVGFLLVLIIPLVQFRGSGKGTLWRRGRRSEVKPHQPLTG